MANLGHLACKRHSTYESSLEKQSGQPSAVLTQGLKDCAEYRDPQHNKHIQEMGVREKDIA